MGYSVVDIEEQEGSRILGVSNDKDVNLKRPDVVQQEKGWHGKRIESGFFQSVMQLRL